MNRGGELVVDSKIPLLDLCYERVRGQIVFCVTLRRRHYVVEAVKPGDKLNVFIDRKGYRSDETPFRTLEADWLEDEIIMHFGRSVRTEISICTLEANVCVVYDGGGHLLLEVNSELLSKNAFRQLKEQFGELVLSDHMEGAFIANI